MQPLALTDNAWIFTSSLYHTTTTVIRSESSVLVVDPNWLPEEVEAIRDFVQDILEGRKCYLLFTHSDYDHIIGYKAFDGSRVIASEAFALSDHKDADVAEAKKFDGDRELSRSYEIVYPEVDLVVRTEGQQIHLDDITLTCYMAPGHTAEGMFTVVGPHQILIAGDYLSDVEFPLVEDIRAYRQTLMKLDQICATHEIRYMIPGHGTMATGPEGVFGRRAQTLEYLDDLEAVSDGKTFPESVYLRRYPAWNELQEWHAENLKHIQ
jgi:glyoxylase-like metal-dependent hydrolase (beta-lactamase superfamily II)